MGKSSNNQMVTYIISHLMMDVTSQVTSLISPPFTSILPNVSIIVFCPPAVAGDYPQRCHQTWNLRTIRVSIGIYNI